MALRLPVGTRPDSDETLAAALRRAASFLCPVTPAALVAAVEQGFAPLLDDNSELHDRLVELTQALIGYGDLVEMGETSGINSRRSLFLGYPRFVRRSDNSFVLIGIRPEDAPLISDDLGTHVDLALYVRILAGTTATREQLVQQGLREISAQRWLRSPAVTDADAFARTYDELLTAQPPSGQIADLKVLDPNKPVTYYRGRWRAPSSDDTGRFVARRSQAYGADLWAYVELAGGEHLRFVDLPLDLRLRGCDEAWRLQAAIDSVRSTPQLARVHGTGHGSVVIGLTIPPPAWLQRRWDHFGRPAQIKGSLFAYEFATKDAREELAFAKELLWLETIVDERSDHEQ
jgi:hypothetical protein